MTRRIPYLTTITLLALSAGRLPAQAPSGGGSGPVAIDPAAQKDTDFTNALAAARAEIVTLDPCVKRPIDDLIKGLHAKREDVLGAYKAKYADAIAIWKEQADDTAKDLDKAPALLLRARADRDRAARALEDIKRRQEDIVAARSKESDEALRKLFETATAELETAAKVAKSLESGVLDLTLLKRIRLDTVARYESSLRRRELLDIEYSLLISVMRHNKFSGCMPE